MANPYQLIRKQPMTGPQYFPGDDSLSSMLQPQSTPMSSVPASDDSMSSKEPSLDDLIKQAQIAAKNSPSPSPLDIGQVMKHVSRPQARLAPAPTPAIPAPQNNIDPNSPTAQLAAKVAAAAAATGISKPGSGGMIDSRQSTSNQDKSVTTTNTGLWADPADMERAAASARELPEFKKQQEGLDQYRQLMKLMMTQPSQVDYSPLANLVDTWTGSNFTKTSPKQESAQDKTKLMMGYGDKVQDDQRDLSKSLLDYVKSQKFGSQTDLQSQLMNQLLLSNVTMKDPNAMKKGGAGSPTQALNQWNNQVNKNFSKDDANADSLNKIITEVHSGNPINDSRIAIIRATADAHGRPNMAEVQNEAGSKSLVDKAANAWDFLTTGKMSEKNRDLIEASLHDLADYGQKARSIQANRLKGMGKSYGLADKDISNTLPDSYVNKYNMNRPAPKTAGAASILGVPQAGTVSRTKELKDMSQAELDAYEQSLHGGK